MKIIFILCCVYLVFLKKISIDEILSDEFINDINSKTKLWTAKKNFNRKQLQQIRNNLLTTDQMRRIDEENRLMHVDELPYFSGRRVLPPENYDQRIGYPSCIKSPGNQASCGSCWLYSTTQAINDRFCQAHVQNNITFLDIWTSPQEITSCYGGDACDGGFVGTAFNYVYNNGIVNKNCFEYVASSSPACPTDTDQICPNSATFNWTTDRYRIKNSYSISDKWMMREDLIIRGPMVGTFSVYSDFYGYGGGIYEHVSGSYEGGHATSTIGYGMDGVVGLYWLVKNSWGSGWGSGGYFMIKDGEVGYGGSHRTSLVIPCQSSCNNLCRGWSGVCSGHGECIGEDICSCDTGYTGIFCDSLSGFSCTPICPEHSTCIAGNICECAAGYGGPNCTNVICDPPCENGGTCIGPNECQCDVEYGGYLCEEPLCSSSCNHGECTSPNVCTCNEGYEGTYCNSPMCYPYCMGNYECKAPNLCECKSTYKNSEAQNCTVPFCSNCVHGSCVAPNTCLCDEGWEGFSCETASTCSPSCKQGTCSSGSCNCNFGWNPPYCDDFTCQTTCNQGTCVAPFYCECDDGWVSVSGTCNTPVCNGYIDPDACSGHGTCDDPDSCSCTNGWSGEWCGILRLCYGIPFDNVTTCSGHGTCVDNDDCNCDTRYTNSSSCNVPDLCYGFQYNDVSVCNSQGTCDSWDDCSCNPQWNDLDCSIPDECFSTPFYDSSVCSSHGTCIAQNSCSCIAQWQNTSDCSIPDMCYGVNFYDNLTCNGNGDCIGNDECACYEGWKGDDCNVLKTCYGISYFNESVCNGNGVCIDTNECSCNAGYAGTYCLEIECYGIPITNVIAACSGHGICKGPNNCTCDSGFINGNCENWVCHLKQNNVSTVCTGHGSCVAVNHCRCDNGYIRYDCSETPLIPLIPISLDDIFRFFDSYWLYCAIGGGILIGICIVLCVFFWCIWWCYDEKKKKIRKVKRQRYIEYQRRGNQKKIESMHSGSGSDSELDKELDEIY